MLDVSVQIKEFFDWLDKVLEHPDNQACALVVLFAIMAVVYSLKSKYSRTLDHKKGSRKKYEE